MTSLIIFGNTQQELQEGLNLLDNYCQRWKLKVNTEKTKIMVFRKGGILPRNLSFFLNNIKLEIVNKFSYLGIVFTSGGSFSEAQKTLAGQAQKAIFKLKKYLYTFVNISPKHTLELFDKLVTPILNYSCEVWGFCAANQIERIHTKFCKHLLGLKISTQNDFIYGELGRINYYSRRLFCCIKYWLKVIKSDNRKYISITYKLLLSDMEQWPNKTNWATLIKTTLGNLGFYHVWLEQGVENEPKCLSILKQRLKDNFIQNLNERLETSSRALFYRVISNFSFQPYLEIVTFAKFRVALSRLRTSSHRLVIETGRWKKPNKEPIVDRKCQICNKLEDEHHFLTECVSYKDLRKTLIKLYFHKKNQVCLRLLTLLSPKILKF